MWHQFLIKTEMTRVNGNALIWPTLADVQPVPLLFTQIQTGGIGNEDYREDEAN
jgi:hypothetical protein